MFEAEIGALERGKIMSQICALLIIIHTFYNRVQYILIVSKDITSAVPNSPIII